MKFNRREILAWRPIFLFGGGMFLALFEAVQPLLGLPVQWEIVSLAATMMGLEMFQRSKEPPEKNGNGDGDDQGNRGRVDSPDGPVGQGSRGNRGAWAVLVGLVGLVSRKGLEVAVVAVALVVPLVLQMVLR